MYGFVFQMLRYVYVLNSFKNVFDGGWDGLEYEGIGWRMNGSD